MNRYRIEQAVVLALGFLLGAGLAIGIAPGDILMWVLAGAILAFCCREFFARNCGGELLLYHRHRHKRPPKTPFGTNA